MLSNIYIAADENKTMFAPPEVAAADKALFVTNLAGLLRQTREEVADLTLSEDGETVTILFNGGGTRQVNINCDSYLAIVKDVAKAI